MSYSINNKLIFIDSFQFLSSALDSSVKNIGKDDFKYLSQEFDNYALDLVKQKKKCVLFNIWAILKSLKKNFQAKKSFYSSLTGKKISGTEYENVLKV